MVHSANSLLMWSSMACLQFGQMPDSSSSENSSPTCFIQHSINSLVECDSIESLHVGHCVNLIVVPDSLLINCI